MKAIDNDTDILIEDNDIIPAEVVDDVIVDIYEHQKNHYVDDAKFYQEILQYINECKKVDVDRIQTGDDTITYPQISEYIGVCIYDIAVNLSKKANFINYPFRDDMIGDAIENCITYIRNFDPVKYNKPFAYFTSICFYAFIRRIQKEKKYKKIVYELIKRCDERGEFRDWLVNVDPSKVLETEDHIAAYLGIPTTSTPSDQDETEAVTPPATDSKQKKRGAKKAPKTHSIEELMNKEPV